MSMHVFVLRNAGPKEEFCTVHVYMYITNVQLFQNVVIFVAYAYDTISYVVSFFDSFSRYALRHVPEENLVLCIHVT